MELRKVQVTGGSSYVLTLPKEWIKQAKIKKNDSLGVIFLPDGNLMITPKIENVRGALEKEFFVDDIKDPTYLFRLLIGAYIMGYTNIVVKSRNKIEAFVRETITQFTQIAIGPEIMEETVKSITITDLLSPTEMPFNKTIRRMHLLVRAMHEDAIRALIESDKNIAREIINRDRDVDRLEWLVARQSNMVLRNITLSKKLGVMPEEANHYYLISRSIERIGDHAVRIAENLPDIIGKKLDDKLITLFISASQMALEIFNGSIEAWVKRDMELANDNIEMKKKLVELCEEITDYPIDAKGRTSIAVSYIAESIRRTGEYSGGISEIVINNLIKD